MDAFVDVTGAGRAEARPERVRIALTASATRESMREASEAVAATAGRLRAVLAEAGIGPADATTTGLRFEPEWRQEGQPQRYAARQSMNVLSPDVTGAGALVTALVEAGGDELIIESLGFESIDMEPLAAAARETAMADARAKAEHYAALAGRSLGEVLSIAEGGDVSAPVLRMEKLAADAAGAAPQPLAAAPYTVNAHVSVRWALV